VENESKKELLLKFGENLRKARESKGFTQARLANELNVEISQISRIERGLINTSVTTIYNISTVLKVDISDLFKLE
jgi:transcriptional regulator with XRE-family HTH domain